ncbi:MAG: phosphomannomutase/phosphoglucomutase [Pseudomonadales bacterium]
MKHIGALSSQEKTPILLMAVLAVVFTLAVVVLFPRFLDTVNAKSLTKAANAVATAQAELLNADIEKIQNTLLEQIKAKDVSTVLQQADPAVLEAAEKQLQEANAAIGMIRVRLIPISTDYSSMHLRFSQLDRLTSAKNNKEIYPEFYGENGKKMFDFLLPVKDQAGKINGFLLAIANESIFSGELEKIKPERASTVLQQKFTGGVTQVVYSTQAKEVNIRAGQISQEAATKIPHWKIVVVPGEELIQESTWGMFWQYLVQGVALCLGALALLLLNRRAAQLVQKAHKEHVAPIQIKGARKVDKGEFAAANAAQANSEDAGLVDPLFQSGDVFDLDLDDDMLEVRAVAPKGATTAKTELVGTDNFSVPETIFRDYDIRGNADADISDELAQRIGRAFATVCLEKGHNSVALAGDGRLSTYRLKEAVRQGLMMSGCSVIDLGTVPTPLMNFATQTLSGTSCGMMVTASHNPASDNGFKMVIDGHTLASEEIQQLRARVQSGDFTEGEGECTDQDIIDAYIDHIVSDVVLAGSYKVVIDCGNGVASVVAQRLLEELGCDVVPLYCDIDGSFPNHQPDPSELSNLNDLVEMVKNEGADLGVAFDGDGDRLAVVTATGEIILPDCLMMLFAKDVISRNPGTDIVFDVKSTRRLNTLISSCGGRPVMCKSGHSHIRNKMVETGAMLGGELSGHIFFKERWFGFDDGVYSAVRLIEIMSIRDQSLDDIFATFPESFSTPEIRIAVPEDKKFSLVKSLIDGGEWGNGKISTLDGVRVDFAKGWGLVRASNTAAALALRFEADDAESLATVQNVFKQQLQSVDSSLPLPF